MIFKSKKQFEKEVYKRIADTRFRDETEGKLYRLEEEVNNLRHVVNRLEDRINKLDDKLTVTYLQPCIDYTTYTTAGGDK